MLSWAFWLLVLIIFHVYFGYPLLLLCLSKLRPAAPVRKADITPMVSLIIPAHNEAAVIAQKIENSLSLAYPRDRLQIIVASDGSTDGTNRIAADYASDGVELFVQPERRGKTALLNSIVPNTRGEIVVFTDANALFKQDAVSKLVRNFADKSVGCVCGEIHFTNQESQTAKGEGLYWRYETILKRKESEIGSVLFTNGAIYSVRKALFSPIDPALADDFVLPMSIVGLGHRSVQEPEAIGYEKTSSTAEDEFGRKARIVARDSRAYFHLRGLLSIPFKPWPVFQLFSHKLLRWMVSLFLITALALNALILDQPIYLLTLFAQLLFYGFAAIGWRFDRVGRPTQSRFISTPYYFCMVNLAALIGLWRTMTGKKMVIWSRAHTTR